MHIAAYNDTDIFHMYSIGLEFDITDGCDFNNYITNTSIVALPSCILAV